MAWVCDWLGNHVSHTHTDAEIHTSAEIMCPRRTFYTHVCLNKHTEEEYGVCFPEVGICFKAQVMRKQMWVTHSHKYQPLEVSFMTDILHLVGVILAAAEKPDCPCESLLARASQFLLLHLEKAVKMKEL